MGDGDTDSPPEAGEMRREVIPSFAEGSDDEGLQMMSLKTTPKAKTKLMTRNMSMR